MSRIVLITGASGGIGTAVAARLARAGALLFLAGRDPDRLAAAERRLSRPARLLPVDLALPDGGARAAQAVAAEAGRLDLLINCAGQLEVGPAEQLGPELAAELMRVNFLGAIRTIHACLPLLRQGTRPAIINVSSLAGRLAPPYMAAYAATKFALNGYCHALRQELRPEGIHVGLILPGPVQTAMIAQRLGGPHYHLPPGVPVIRPERVAQAIIAAADRRLGEVVLPRRLGLASRVGAAFPALVDLIYAASDPQRSQGEWQ